MSSEWQEIGTTPGSFRCDYTICGPDGTVIAVHQLKFVNPEIPWWEYTCLETASGRKEHMLKANPRDRYNRVLAYPDLLNYGMCVTASPDTNKVNIDLPHPFDDRFQIGHSPLTDDPPVTISYDTNGKVVEIILRAEPIPKAELPETRGWQDVLPEVLNLIRSDDRGGTIGSIENAARYIYSVALDENPAGPVAERALSTAEGIIRLMLTQVPLDDRDEAYRLLSSIAFPYTLAAVIIKWTPEIIDDFDILSSSPLDSKAYQAALGRVSNLISEELVSLPELLSSNPITRNDELLHVQLTSTGISLTREQIEGDSEMEDKAHKAALFDGKHLPMDRRTISTSNTEIPYGQAFQLFDTEYTIQQEGDQVRLTVRSLRTDRRDQVWSVCFPTHIDMKALLANINDETSVDIAGIRELTRVTIE